MSEELKVTKSKVREAAEGCPVAKDVLKKMFPEAFGDEVDPNAIYMNLYNDDSVGFYAGCDLNNYFEPKKRYRIDAKSLNCVHRGSSYIPKIQLPQL